MPQAIAIAAAYVADFAAAYLGDAVFAAVYYTTEVALTVGLTIAAAELSAPKMPGPTELQTPLKQPMPPRQSAFGRVRVGGSYALFTVGSGGGKKVSHDVYALLDGRSHQVVSYYLNDDLMAPFGAYYWAPGATGKYGGGGSNPPNLVQIDSRLGLATETAYAISAAVPVWTSDHRGDGVTSMLVRCKEAKREDQSGDFPNGCPVASAVVDAQLIFDPREGGQSQGSAATYAWSDNPPLCVLAYTTDASGGMGLDYTRFWAPTIAFLAAAANECDGVVTVSGMHATLADPADAGDNSIFLADTTGLTVGAVITLATETVTVSSLGGGGEVTLTDDLVYAHAAGELAYWDAEGEQARYRCSGTYRHDMPPGDVIKSALSTFDGWLGQRGDGALVLRTNTVYDPTVILTDRHIVGYQLQHYLPDEQATNQLIVSYTDPASAFNKAEAGYVQDDADIADRGQLRSQELYLQWAPSGPQALQVARAVLARATQPLRGSLTCNLAGLAVLGERYVRVQISELAALNDLIVEVTGKPTFDLAAMTVSFPFIAAGGEIGVPPGGGDTPDPVSVPGPPSGSPLDPLDAPTITSVTPDYPDSGGGVSGARLLIEVSDEGDVAWKVRWKLSADTSWTEMGVTDPTGSPPELLTGLIAASGSVDVQVAYITASQVSPWSATETVTISAPVDGYTDEDARDAIGAALVGGTGITVTVDDANDTITLDATLGPLDGDYGDIVISGSGSTLTIDTGAVTLAKMANVANNRVLGNVSGSSAAPAELTASDLATLLGASVKSTESLIIACSDELTPIIAGAGKVTFRMPYAFTVSAVRASLSAAQSSGSIFTVDINESGTSILSAKLTIDNTETTSATATTAAVITDSSLADNAEITVDVDQVGDGTARGLKVYLIGTRT